MKTDLKGKVVMVTGANQGVGYQIAQVMLNTTQPT
jgi:NAD(P)-dependent dehydrogenase (short-subunit alcohol dehydrogenase family)